MNSTPASGLTERTVDYISSVKKEAPWIREFRLNALKTFLVEAAAHPLGDQGPRNDRFRQDPLLPLQRPEAQALLGRGARRTSSGPSSAWAFPSRSASSWPASRPSSTARRPTRTSRRPSRSRASSSSTRREALKEHPEIFRKWFGKVIPTGDNKFSALNSAVFSGGSFIYVPPGVKVAHPLQAYFRINAENFGQFERTLIIVRRGLRGHLHGRAAPRRSSRPRPCTAPSSSWSP